MAELEKCPDATSHVQLGEGNLVQLAEHKLEANDLAQIMKLADTVFTQVAGEKDYITKQDLLQLATKLDLSQFNSL